MNKVTLIALFIIPAFLHAQPKLKKLDKSSIPSYVQYKGNIKNAVSWTDNAGSHIVITTETGAYETKTAGGSDGSDAELYAYHYDSSNKRTWQIYDYIRDCPVDMEVNFVKNSFAVTDLDNDGFAEIWLMYKTVCRGDVSPAGMKIIMVENNTKHAMRGRNKVHQGGGQYEGGEYNYDEAFKNAPAVFKTYAQELWKKNLMEKWESD